MSCTYLSAENEKESGEKVEPVFSRRRGSMVHKLFEAAIRAGAPNHGITSTIEMASPVLLACLVEALAQAKSSQVCGTIISERSVRRK